jgi:alpha-tubulin suppressor-like RCC1 family protein
MSRHSLRRAISLAVTLIAFVTLTPAIHANDGPTSPPSPPGPNKHFVSSIQWRHPFVKGAAARNALLSGPGVGTNVAITNSLTDYTETATTYDPTFHANLFAGSNQNPSGPETAYYSTNTGTTWQASQVAPPLGTLAPNDYASDPAVTYDNAGNLYYAYLGVHDYNNPLCANPKDTQLLISKSTDKGATWITGSPTQIVGTSFSPDQEHIVVDSTASLHSDRLYVGFTNVSQCGNGAQPVVVARSDDGTTWSTSTVYGAGIGENAVTPAIGPAGQVYVSWNDWGCCYGNPTGTKSRLIMATSTDGGVTFPTQVVFAGTGVGQGAVLPNYSNLACGAQLRPVWPSPGIATDLTQGPRGGYIYVVYANIPTSSTDGRMHIFFVRSTDQGASWSQPVQLDSGNTKNDSWQPAIALDQSTGLVTVVWYDRRDDSGNALYRTYYTQSTDGGLTWLASQGQVSTYQSDPRIDCNGTGDYMGMTAADGVARPVWVDTRNGSPQLFTAGIYEALAGPTTRLMTFAMGNDHTVAVKATDGTVWAWGRNDDGQLAYFTPNTSCNTCPSNAHSDSPGQSQGLTQQVASVSGGQETTQAVSTESTVWNWGGSLTYGQPSTPTQVTAIAGSAIATGGGAGTGGGYQAALTADGTVWNWGNLLGTSTYVTTPSKVGGGTGFVAMAAGDNHVLGLKSDGTVWAFGNNSAGQLGNNSQTASPTFVQVKGVAGSGFLTGVSAIAAGGSHSLALKSNGTVFSWGSNTAGQLGVANGKKGISLSKTPVQVKDPADSTGNLTAVISVAAGKSHSVALKSAGSVWTWGDNTSGQLGNNNSSVTSSYSPVAVFGLSGMVEIGSQAEAQSTLALDSFSRLWGWGRNYWGELGIGSDGPNVFSPVLSSFGGLRQPVPGPE